MLTHLTPMIAALSLALTAGSFSGWSRLSSMFEQRCTEAHDHAVEQGQRVKVVKRRQVQDVQVLSFGP